MNRKFKISLTIIVALFIITLAIVGTKNLVPQSKAEETINATLKTEYTIKFSEGSIPKTVRKASTGVEPAETIVFDPFEKKVTTSFAHTIIMPGTKFSDIVPSVKLTDDKKVDNETFYFGETVEPDSWSYSFTGWHVVGTDTYIPANTVFQPGDTITEDVLKKYAPNGVLELEAVWGKVTYICNEYTGRLYTDYWIYDKTSTEDGRYAKTGAWNYKYENGILTLNKGRSTDNPISSLDYAYYIRDKEKDENYKNAYFNVMMLTGDLDYIKGNQACSGQTNFFSNYEKYNKTFTDNGNTYSVEDSSYNENSNYVWGDYAAQKNLWGIYWYNGNSTTNSMNKANWQAMTFKSLNEQNYNLFWNGYGYSDVMYGSIRFDNICLGAPSKQKRPEEIDPSGSSTETSFSSGQGDYIETTSRTKETGFGSYVLRPGETEYVVINGGRFSSWQTSWASQININYNLNWYMGSNATISGDINLGTTAHYGTTNMAINVDKFTLTITGGTVYGNIYGGGNVSAQPAHGDRIINIIGDKGNSTKTNPKIAKNIYGGAKQSELIGNTYINIYGCTNIAPSNSNYGNIYGGGEVFNATVHGNTYVNISDSKINGDVFGGGYNGNIDIDSTTGNGGNINVKISNSEITGNVFGVGMGGPQTTSQPVTVAASNDKYHWQEEKFSPNDSFFTSIKNSDYGDYTTDWSWNKPASGFPFLVTNEESNQYGYVCTYITKYTSWVDNSASSLTFGRTRTFAYLSLAYAKKDVQIDITGSTIGGIKNKGNVYGGGSIAIVHGNVGINLDNCQIKGNVYGGGDGTAKPQGITLYEPLSEEGYVEPTYTKNDDGKYEGRSESVENLKSLGTFNWSNDVTLLEQGGIDYDKKLVYSPNMTDKLGSVGGNTTINITGNSTILGSLYGGGNAGEVRGNTKVTIDDASNIAGNVHGGGYSGKVINDTTVQLNSASAVEVFGGGYSGDICGNTNVTISKGTFTNVFAGGDQAEVIGNTTLTIGDELDRGVTISSLAYGGGRGKGYQETGDASKVTTVHGTANVTIQGIHTIVGNYGSTKLGAVSGDVDVRFINYSTGNSTQMYKTMNGIDRATNVYFIDNSYVNLTNRDANGKFQGIRSIENLYVTEGNGLKISAPGEISGNFYGGGEMYLDSEVCLTIKGSIIGQTELVLNPILTSEGYRIKGGIGNPYMNVYNEYPESTTGEKEGLATALVSGDSRYEIQYANDGTSTKYYIHQDVKMDDGIKTTIRLKNDKDYTGNEEDWAENAISILQNENLSANMILHYQFKQEIGQEKKYQDIERSLIIKSGNETVNIPKGTYITMIVNNSENNVSYYNYKTKEALTKIALKDFYNVKVPENKFKQVEIRNVGNVATGDTLTQTYTYNEEYRFVIDFSECENGLIANKTYNVLLNLTDKSNNIDELSSLSENYVKVCEENTVSYNPTINKEKAFSNEIIEFTGTLNTKEIDNTVDYQDIGRNIIAIPSIKDSLGNNIEIPNGTIIRINGTEYSNLKSAELKILDNIGKKQTKMDNYKMVIDFSKVAPEYILDTGDYKLVLKYYTEKDGIIYNKLNEREFSFSVIKKNTNEFGIKTTLEASGLQTDKVQLFEANCERTLKVQVDNKNNKVEGANVQIKLMKRTAPFEYTEIKNTLSDKEILNENIQENNNVNIKYNGNLDKGAYKIVVELYDKYGNLYTEDYANFIVL